MAAALVAASLSACVDGGTDAGRRAPADPGPLPSHAAAVDGPAIGGTVTDADGNPVPGAEVTVRLLRTREERIEVGIGAAFSLGMSCLIDTRGCSTPTARGRAAADGSYAVGLPAHAGDPAVGVAVTVIAVLDDGDRVGTTVELPEDAVRGATVDLPVASTSLTISQDGAGLAVAMPATEGARDLGGVTVTATPVSAGGDAATATTNGSTTLTDTPVDVRLAEDQHLLVVGHQPATIDGRPASLSATGRFEGATVPASRGAACSVTDADGEPRPQLPCGLTDGQLFTSWELDDDPRCLQGPCPGSAQSDHRDVYVNLTEPVDGELLVVRGCGFTCTVAVSVDGQSFRELAPPPMGASPDATHVVELPGDPVRVVRVRTATGGFFTSLHEVSVFARS